MGFGATESRRRQAGRKHAHRIHTCKCGKVIKGNAFYIHKRVCQYFKNLQINPPRA